MMQTAAASEHASTMTRGRAPRVTVKRRNGLPSVGTETEATSAPGKSRPRLATSGDRFGSTPMRPLSSRLGTPPEDGVEEALGACGAGTAVGAAGGGVPGVAEGGDVVQAIAASEMNARERTVFSASLGPLPRHATPKRTAAEPWSASARGRFHAPGRDR